MYDHVYHDISSTDPTSPSYPQLITQRPTVAGNVDVLPPIVEMINEKLRVCNSTCIILESIHFLLKKIPIICVIEITYLSTEKVVNI